MAGNPAKPDPVSYLPLARAAATRWHNFYRQKVSRRPVLTWSCFFSEAQYGLVWAAHKWDPLLPACGVQDCRLTTQGTACPHGSYAYEYSALAKHYVNGQCSHLIRGLVRRWTKEKRYANATGGLSRGYDFVDGDGARLARLARALDLTPEELTAILADLASGHIFDGDKTLAVLRGLRAYVKA